MFDLKIPFFRPLWRRIATVIVCIGWGLVEFANNAAAFGLLFCGMGALAAYQFFITWTDPGGGGGEGGGDGENGGGKGSGDGGKSGG
ncbi:MAG: hypothetical protein ABJM29_10185 [Rhizobiaceae bacterium]